MAITEEQLRELVTAIDRWGAALYLPTFGRELGTEAEPDDVDQAHAEADKLGVAWRIKLNALLADEDLDAEQVAADIHVWGAAEAESARRSAVSYANPGRPLLGEFQLEGETTSQEARLKWAEPLVALLDRTPTR